MSKVRRQTIEHLMELLGGVQNIVTLTHCITRLRLALQHPDKANIDDIKTFPMVKGALPMAANFKSSSGLKLEPIVRHCRPSSALLCGVSDVLTNGIGVVDGLPGILSIKPSFWGTYLVAIAIAIVIPVMLTATIYQRKQRLSALPNG